MAVLAEGGESWREKAVMSLARWAGHADMEDTLADMMSSRTRTRDELKEVKERARGLRSKLGFLDMVLLQSEVGASETLARAGVLAAYPRAVFSGGWALVPTGRASTTAETVAGVQLGIAQPLKVEEFCQGLERAGAFLDRANVLPPCTTVTALLALAGAISLVGDRVSGEGRPPRGGTVQQWLVQVLSSEPGAVLHRNELLERASASGIKWNTLSSHLSYDPVVRQERFGVYRLVGHRPSAGDVQAAQKRGRALITPSRVSLRSHSGVLHLEIAFGSQALSTGVLYARTSVARIWPASGLAVRCSCGHVTSQRIKIAKSNLYGWNSFLKHARSAHPQLDLSAVVLRMGTKELQVK